jgi:hypothetical protein
LEWGDELSARHASNSAAGTWDFVHVAAAQHLRRRPGGTGPRCRPDTGSAFQIGIR